MSILVLCVYAKDGKDLKCPFKVGDTLHASEAPIECPNREKYYLIEEYSYSYGLDYSVWSKHWFVPIEPTREEFFDYFKNEIVRQLKK
jgi:hypothetical protein